MNYKIAILAIIALACSNGTLSQPEGKYCGNILGNILTIDVNVSQHSANVTADIFGTNLNCPKELYTYNTTSSQLQLPSDPNDCLNKALSEYGVCPCPPDVLYDSKINELTIENTPLGSIPLKSC